MDKVHVKYRRGVVGEDGEVRAVGDTDYVTRPFADFLFYHRKAEPYVEPEPGEQDEKPAKKKGKSKK